MGRSAIKSVLVFLLVVVGAASAQAAIITNFANRAAYDAAFPGSVVENWDGVANGTQIPNGGTLNGITYNSSAGVANVTNSFFNTTDPNSLGRTPQSFFDATDSIVFTFANPISSFGIDINTFATSAGAFTAMTNLGDVIGSVFDPFPGLTTGQFIGFASNLPFNSVTITGQGVATYTLDTMRATAAPEPSTLGLIGLGLLGLSAMRRRRRKLGR
jgi:hypothetical protein